MQAKHGWVELLECGLAHPDVLATAGVADRSGLALGAGLDRAVMLRKGIDDIRLLRSTDARVGRQMLDLSPYRSVSVQPPATRDMSVAAPAGTDDEELGDLVRCALDSRARESVDGGDSPVPHPRERASAFGPGAYRYRRRPREPPRAGAAPPPDPRAEQSRGELAARPHLRRSASRQRAPMGERCTRRISPDPTTMSARRAPDNRPGFEQTSSTGARAACPPFHSLETSERPPTSALSCSASTGAARLRHARFPRASSNHRRRRSRRCLGRLARAEVAPLDRSGACASARGSESAGLETQT